MSDNEKYPGLYIGTSGWSYQHWSGIFYPIDIQPDKYLEHYITKFNCVELNSSFYHLPRDTTISGWAKRTPEKFRFCPKMSRFITHQMRLAKIEEPLKKYFDLFKGMRMRLGPILVQLPPGLSYNKSLVVDFLGTLKNQYFEYRFAIEIRHKSWIRDDFFDLLKQNGIAFVIADSGKRYPYYETVTSSFIYMRFHGREKLYATDYSETDLYYYAGKIREWLYENKEVWAFFNNDFNGFAAKNAERLRQIIYSLKLKAGLS